MRTSAGLKETQASGLPVDGLDNLMCCFMIELSRSAVLCCRWPTLNATNTRHMRIPLLPLLDSSQCCFEQLYSRESYRILTKQTRKSAVRGTAGIPAPELEHWCV